MLTITFSSIVAAYAHRKFNPPPPNFDTRMHMESMSQAEETGAERERESRGSRSGNTGGGDKRQPLLSSEDREP